MNNLPGKIHYMIFELSFVFLGYMIFDRGSSKATGLTNEFDKIIGRNTSLIFKIPRVAVCVHIHHWVYCAAATLYFTDLRIVCASLGGALHGIISYSDFYRIVYRYEPLKCTLFLSRYVDDI